MTHRSDPVPIEARKRHGLEQPEPGRRDPERAIDLLTRIGDQRKRMAAPPRIPPDRGSGGVEEGDGRQAARVQARVLLRKIVQAQVAHRAGGIAEERHKRPRAARHLECGPVNGAHREGGRRIADPQSIHAGGFLIRRRTLSGTVNSERSICRLSMLLMRVTMTCPPGSRCVTVVATSMSPKRR